MKPLRDRLLESAKKSKVAFSVIERDYAISYILAGIAKHNKLSKSLIFKGGTALKKLYFGSYRFSEDLDFTSVESPKGAELEAAIEDVRKEAEALLRNCGAFNLSLKKYLEKNPHPGGQDAFIMQVQFPWHNKEPLCSIMLEITHDEKVFLKPESRKLIHGYGEELDAELLTLSLEEITAEKMRCLLQTMQKLGRDKNRPRPRDFYDLWSVFTVFGDNLDLKNLQKTLKPKCADRNVSYNVLEDFLAEALLVQAKPAWESSLKYLAPGLPEFDAVIAELRTLLPTYFPNLSAAANLE